MILRLVQAPWPDIAWRPIGPLNIFTQLQVEPKNYTVAAQSSGLDVLKFPLDGLRERTGGVGMRIKILNGLFLCVKQRRRGGPSLLSNWERRGSDEDEFHKIIIRLQFRVPVFVFIFMKTFFNATTNFS